MVTLYPPKTVFITILCERHLSLPTQSLFRHYCRILCRLRVPGDDTNDSLPSDLRGHPWRRYLFSGQMPSISSDVRVVHSGSSTQQGAPTSILSVDSTEQLLPASTGLAGLYQVRSSYCSCVSPTANRRADQQSLLTQLLRCRPHGSPHLQLSHSPKRRSLWDVRTSLVQVDEYLAYILCLPTSYHRWSISTSSLKTALHLGWRIVFLAWSTNEATIFHFHLPLTITVLVSFS